MSVLYRKIDRHKEQKPRARVLVGERAWMLAEARARTHRHAEVQDMMIVEAHTRKIT